MLAITDPIRDAARRLREAELTGTPCAPIRELLCDGDVDAAYAVQSLITGEKLAGGGRLVGRKIGLTSVKVQQQIGVDSPDFGSLFADTSYAYGEPVPAGRFIQPKVEGEIALVMGRGIATDQPTFGDLIRATEYVLPALEIVDSRIANWDIRLLDTVADNASAGGFVLGGRPERLGDHDLAATRMEMSVNGEKRSQGSGADCLGHPLTAALWLARTLARHGEPLREGDIVLTGALGPMVEVAPGDEVLLKVGGMCDTLAIFGRDEG